VKGDSLKQWMDANWRFTLGYIPIFHLLVRGGICFEMRSELDVEVILSKDWLWGPSGLV